MDKPRVVVCAAIRNKDGLIICSPRHFDQTAAAQVFVKKSLWLGLDFAPEQGFVDQYGIFLSREEAFIVAEAADQIKYRCGGDEGVLFSENLY